LEFDNKPDEPTTNSWGQPYLALNGISDKIDEQNNFLSIEYKSDV